MPIRFTARVVCARNLDDLNTFVIALSNDADGPTCTLELQKALEVDENDPDTYCLVVNGGATPYGGVSSYCLKDGLLALWLDERAARALGTTGFEIKLDLNEGEQSELRRGLHRLFGGDRRAPTDLSGPASAAVR